MKKQANQAEHTFLGPSPLGQSPVPRCLFSGILNMSAGKRTP